MAGRVGDESAGPARAAAGLAQHHLRLQSVARDTELDLPPSLPLPDGEEFPGTANRIHIRTAEQVHKHRPIRNRGTRFPNPKVGRLNVLYPPPLCNLVKR